MLRSSPLAAYCLPTPDLRGLTDGTRELDHLIAFHFELWDILVHGKRPFTEAYTELFAI
jgi:hypothetical protein